MDYVLRTVNGTILCKGGLRQVKNLFRRRRMVGRSQQPKGAIVTRLHHSVAFASALVAMLGQVPALAAPSFGNDDLKGEYLFVVVEVNSVPLPTGGTRPEHCVSAGTAVFDGAGSMTMSATMRCNLSGSRTFSETQYYSVNPDGSFLISVWPDMADPVHGQLVDHGRTLLLDGTLRPSGENIAWWGTAMKR